MINYKHVIFQGVVLLFLPVTKIAEITCTLYQGLSKRLLHKENVDQKESPHVNLPLHVLHVSFSK